MTSGIINVNKPCGITSFDVCAIVRRILGIRRIGHFGTLDPQASEVLPITVESACRIMEYLNDETKQYECSARLGISTDTLDRMIALFVGGRRTALLLEIKPCVFRLMV